jgi:hypothetical protein
MAETLTVVTERVGMRTDKQMNAVVVVPMRPWRIVLTRTVRVYLQSLAGLLLLLGTNTVVSLGTDVTGHDLWTTCKSAVIVAGFTALATLIQNSLELWWKVDASNPALRA